MESLDTLLHEAHKLTEEIKSIDAMAKFLATASCEMRIYIDKWEPPVPDRRQSLQSIMDQFIGRSEEPMLPPTPVINFLISETVALRTLETIMLEKRIKLTATMSKIKSIKV